MMYLEKGVFFTTVHPIDISRATHGRVLINKFVAKVYREGNQIWIIWEYVG